MVDDCSQARAGWREPVRDVSIFLLESWDFVTITLLSRTGKTGAATMEAEVLKGRSHWLGEGDETPQPLFSCLFITC